MFNYVGYRNVCEQGHFKYITGIQTCKICSNRVWVQKSSTKETTASFSFTNEMGRGEYWEAGHMWLISGSDVISSVTMGKCCCVVKLIWSNISSLHTPSLLLGHPHLNQINMFVSLPFSIIHAALTSEWLSCYRALYLITAVNEASVTVVEQGCYDSYVMSKS